MAGHATVTILLGDDDRLCPPGQAELTLPIEACGLDRFVAMLCEAEQRRSGEAVHLAAQESENKPQWWKGLSARGKIKGIKERPESLK